MAEVSRQRRWQIKKQQEGLCIICAQPAVTNYHCLKHAVQKREARRRQSGSVRRNNSLTYRLEAQEK